MGENERDRVCRQGSEAWRRLQREESWVDWLKVGEALQVGREWAMDQAGTNKAEGKAYIMAFGKWLAKYKLDDMDKGDRSRLYTVMDNLPMIEEWRQRLTLTERLKFNHPNVVLRKWKASIKPPPERAKETPSMDTWVAELLDKPKKKRAESLYDLLLRLNLSMSHLEDAHETYARRLGLR
jgi:hypothetical protein